MPEFHVNLIRGLVPSPRQRRARYGVMLAYLGVSGAALAVTVAISTSWLIRASAIRRELDAIERRFSVSHREQGGIEPYAAWLERHMSDRVAMLRSVDRELASRPEPARLLYHLAQSLPAGVTLRSLALDSAAGSFSLELLVSGTGAPAGLGPSDLIAQWKQNAALGAQVAQIAYVGSQRQSKADKNDVVWRFSGQMARKEA